MFELWFGRGRGREAKWMVEEHQTRVSALREEIQNLKGSAQEV